MPFKSICPTNLQKIQQPRSSNQSAIVFNQLKNHPKVFPHTRIYYYHQSKNQIKSAAPQPAYHHYPPTKKGGTTMSLTINPRVQQIEPSGIRKISNQLINYPDAINLTIGQPDFPTPERIKQAAHKAIDDNKTTYSHNAGLLELRQAVSTFFTDKYSFTYNPQTEIIITTGASEAMDTVFRTILEEGDEVIVPAPIYTGYEPLITLAGATPIYLDTTKTNFIPDPTQLEQTHHTQNKSNRLQLSIQSNRRHHPTRNHGRTRRNTRQTRHLHHLRRNLQRKHIPRGTPLIRPIP